MSNLRTYPGFHVGESADATGREFLAATGPWTQAAIDYARDHDIRELHLNVYAGWADSSVGFLASLPQLEAVHIVTGKGVDLSPLYELPQLKLLGIAGAVKGRVDFTRMKSLAELRLEKWDAKKFASAFDCARLAVLALSNFPGPNMESLGGLSSLQELRLSLGKVRSLQGLSAMTHLRRIFLEELNHLETLEGIAGLAELETIWIYRTKRLRRIDGVEALRSLTEFMLTAVPRLESLRPLEHCLNLQKVLLLQNTNVADGDIARLETLPNLRNIRFNERTHYNANLTTFASRGVNTLRPQLVRGDCK
jgi:hypothetical protein